MLVTWRACRSRRLQVPQTRARGGFPEAVWGRWARRGDGVPRGADGLGPGARSSLPRPALCGPGCADRSLGPRAGQPFFQKKKKKENVIFFVASPCAVGRLLCRGVAGPRDVGRDGAGDASRGRAPAAAARRAAQPIAAAPGSLCGTRAAAAPAPRPRRGAVSAGAGLGPPGGPRAVPAPPLRRRRGRPRTAQCPGPAPPVPRRPDLRPSCGGRARRLNTVCAASLPAPGGGTFTLQARGPFLFTFKVVPEFYLTGRETPFPLASAV